MLFLLIDGNGISGGCDWGGLATVAAGARVAGFGTS
jgi:hypothetical protein